MVHALCCLLTVANCSELNDAFLDHPVLSVEIANEKNGPSTIKHLKQQVIPCTFHTVLRTDDDVISRVTVGTIWRYLTVTFNGKYYLCRHTVTCRCCCIHEYNQSCCKVPYSLKLTVKTSRLSHLIPSLVLARMLLDFHC